MKKIYVLASFLIGFYTSTQAQACFSSPDGTDGNGWSYKDYIIPTGFKIDSIYMNATRPGYPANNDALVMWYCPNSTTYGSCTGGKPTLVYSNFTTSMYNVWLRVDTANNISPGMVRVSLPTNAGANWNQLCIATSPINTNTLNCYTTPDGTDGNGWSYKDFVIPTGYKIDSIYMNATRPGYTASNEDMVMWYCPNSTTYGNCTGGKPTLLYSNFNTSMYNTWLRVDTANNVAPGMIRVSLPTNAGAIWNQLCIATSLISTSNCYTTPDGTDGNGWSYKDFVIPTGYKIDSIYMNATRPGYTASNEDMVMWYCPNSTTYGNCTGGKPTLLYSNFNTSMYNTWLRVDTANNVAPGMIRVSLPTNAGAIWNQLCIATSLVNTTSVKQIKNNNELNIYPNPNNGSFVIESQNTLYNVRCTVYDVNGKVVLSQTINGKTTIDASSLNEGVYNISLQSNEGVVNKRVVIVR